MVGNLILFVEHSHWVWSEVSQQTFVYIRVAVPGRNRTLICCVLRSHYCVRSTVTQYFRYGWGSYVLCKVMNTWHVYTACMGPTPNGSSALQRGNALEIRNGIMFDFYPGLPHVHVLWIHEISFW